MLAKTDKNMPSKINVPSDKRENYAVFLRTVITDSYRVKSLFSPMEIVRKVAMLSYVHALEIEIVQSAKEAILSRNYSP